MSDTPAQPPERLDLPDHAAPAPAPVSTPPTYDAATVDAILADVSTGKSLRRACQARNVPHNTILRWVREDSPPGLSDQYARAREQQAHALADGIVEIATSEDAKADPNLLRVRLDAAKWAASKILPRVYGDRIDVNANVTTHQVGWVLDLRPDETPVLDGTAVRVDGALPAPTDLPDVGAE